MQGVFFRASTRDQARALGLDGYARNLADSRVEVVARGEPAAVEALAAWLAHGPALARVDELERAAWDEAVAPGFGIG